MTTYPIPFPAQLPARASVVPRDVVGVSESPFSLDLQTQRRQGQRWEVDIRFPRMTRAKVQVVRGFRLAMRGRYGTCLWSPMAEGAPLGANTGVPVVDGAGQAGDVLLASGGCDE